MEKPCENDKIVGWLCICETCAKSDNPVCVNGDFEYYEATWGPFCDEYRKDFPEARYFYAKENVNFKEDSVWKLHDNRPIVFDDSLQYLDAEICYQYELFHEKALKKWDLFCEQYHAKDNTDTENLREPGNDTAPTLSPEIQSVLVTGYETTTIKAPSLCSGKKATKDSTNEQITLLRGIEQNTKEIAQKIKIPESAEKKESDKSKPKRKRKSYRVDLKSVSRTITKNPWATLKQLAVLTGYSESTLYANSDVKKLRNMTIEGNREAVVQHSIKPNDRDYTED